jgi:hypothetical protein
MVLRVSQKMIFGRRSGYQSYRGIAFVGVMTKFEKRIKLILYHRQPMNMTFPSIHTRKTAKKAFERNGFVN